MPRKHIDRHPTNYYMCAMKHVAGPIGDCPADKCKAQVEAQATPAHTPDCVLHKKVRFDHCVRCGATESAIDHVDPSVGGHEYESCGEAAESRVAALIPHQGSFPFHTTRTLH